jgi:hypothetical protein
VAEGGMRALRGVEQCGRQLGVGRKDGAAGGGGVEERADRAAGAQRDEALPGATT